MIINLEGKNINEIYLSVVSLEILKYIELR